MAYLLPSMMLTTAGKQLYAKAHNGECAIKFSEIVVGTGYINSADEIPALTGLKNKVNATVGTLSVQTINDSTVCISARITAADSPFYMREIGLMAEDPDEGDILYGYCNFADTADYVEIYNGAIGSAQDIDIYVAVSNTENFSVDITDVVTATPEDVAAAKEELDEKINSETASRIAADETLDSEKIEDKIVTALPSTQILYNFNDSEPLFTVPSIGETVKGISETVQDTANGGYYQRVCSTGAEGASTAIGSTANVYSQFDFETITANATDVTIEFDFQYVINGRMRLAICDLDTVNALDNSEIRYNTNGIAIDLFSTSNSRFQVNSDGGTRSSFFGAWLHGKFIIDFKTKTVDYSIFAENSPSDSMAGTEPFRDSECNRITGIAVYTWLADDTVLFDNIKIVSRINVAQNTRYIIYQNGRYQTYKYIDGEPVLLAGDDLSGFAAINSPNFTGAPTAPTVAKNDNSTKIATTAFVNNFPGGIQHIKSTADKLKHECNVCFVSPGAGTNMPEQNRGYLVIAVDNYWYTDGGTTKWLLLAVDALNGKRYMGTTDTDSSYYNVFAYDIEWAEIDTQYSSTPTKIGTWIDNTPIWRFLFKRNLTQTEITNGRVALADILPIGSSDLSNSFVVNARITVYLGAPGVVDDMQGGNLTGGSFEIPTQTPAGELSPDSDGIYGFVDIATNAAIN